MKFTKMLRRGAQASMATLTTLAWLSPVWAASSPDIVITDPLPRSFYVSKCGNNTDGTTWATAWNELNQINWSKISSGATISIDGGAQSMTYHSSLTVPAQAPAVQIVRAQAAGKSGQVIVENLAPMAVGSRTAGISIMTPNAVSINGGNWRGIVVKNFPIGVNVAAQPVATPLTSTASGTSNNGSSPNIPSGNTTLSGLLIENCGYPTQPLGVAPFGTGILDGGRCTVLGTIVKDCAYGAICYGGGATLNISNSWFHNNFYFGKTSDTGGIDNHGGNSTVNVSNSVLGPGLNYSIADYKFQGITSTSFGTKSGTNMQNCLLIDPARQGISVFYDNSGTFKGSHITSFMTDLSPYSDAARCMKDQANSVAELQITNSVIYGGTVEVPLTAQPLAGQPNIPVGYKHNTQFKTHGNTTFLAPREVDPQFKTNVGLYKSNVPITTLLSTDYSLSSSSPAIGAGSSLTSVAQLLSRFPLTAQPQ